MSVIFKTLKKLKTESADRENSENQLVRRRRIYFFKKALYSPSYVLLLILILTIIGAGTLYGHYHLRKIKSGDIKDFDIPNTDNRHSTDVHTFETSENKKVKSLDWAKGSDSNRIEYLPPETNNNKVKVYSLKKSENIEIPVVADKKKSSESKETTERNTASKIKTKKSEKPEAEDVSSVPEVEKIFLRNAKKNAKIAGLVADIRWEIEHGDKKRTETLLDELALLKGQNNSYVLKLKAVWHIHNNEYERAEDFLNTVLTKNEHDQEAGINMAIIEIEKQQIKKAYQRLKKLRTIYPENVRIAEIIKNLKLLLNKTRLNHLSRDNKS